MRRFKNTLANLTPVFARIALRYLSGALLGIGVIDMATSQAIVDDPDLLILVGAGIGALVEGMYALARRFGWAT